MLQMVPDKLLQVNCDIEEYIHLKDLERRKLYLSSEINSLECEEGCNEHLSSTGHIIRQIIEYNEEDKELPSDERIPIRLFINSPGGNVSEGFPLVPVYLPPARSDRSKIRWISTSVIKKKLSERMS